MRKNLARAQVALLKLQDPEFQPARFNRLFYRPHLQLVMTQCESCGYVYKAALAICSLYAITGNPIAAAICVIVATGSYNNCVGQYCNPAPAPQPPPQSMIRRRENAYAA